MTAPSPAPTRTPRAWSAIVVVVVAVLLVGVGIGGRVTSTPEPTPVPYSSSPPSAATASDAALDAARSAGPLPPLRADGEIVVDAHGDASSVAGSISRVVGRLNGRGIYVITVACSGPGAINVASGTATSMETQLNGACDTSPLESALEVTDVASLLNVTVDNRASWRLIAARAGVTPEPVSGVVPPVPQPTRPAVPCRSTARLARPPDVNLFAGSVTRQGEVGPTTWKGTSVDRRADPVPTSGLVLDQAHPAEIRIGGDGCATAWRILLLRLPASASQRVLESVTTVAENLGRDAVPQNRFRVDGLPPGEWILKAELAFPDGDEAVYWRVTTPAFLFGRGTLTVGRRVVTGGLLGCPTWVVGDAGGGDSCGPLPWFVADAPTIHLAAPTTGRFEIPGWAIAGGTVTSVRTSDARRTDNPTPIATSVVGAGSGPVAVAIPSGDVIVRVSLGAVRGNARFDDDYVFHAIVGR